MATLPLLLFSLAFQDPGVSPPPPPSQPQSQSSAAAAGTTAPPATAAAPVATAGPTATAAPNATAMQHASAPPNATAAGSRDVVELKSGETLEGRITTEIDGYLELEMEGGAVIGLGRGSVAAVRRGAGRSGAEPPAPLPPRDEWFVLHDGTGAAVGWLHATASTTAEGHIRLHEEYEFTQGTRRFQVTALAMAGGSLEPRSCYFRERVSEAHTKFAPNEPLSRAERVTAERIVEATVDGDELVIVRVDGDGRHERKLPFPAGATFPLLLRERARLAARQEALMAVLFDPAIEEFGTRHADAGRSRTVTLDGRDVQVTEFAETTASGRNAAWIDATSKTLRLELAGPSLVAVPSSAESASLAVGAVSIAQALVVEANGRFGLWVPNPAWQPPAEPSANRISLACRAHGATIGLSLLTHLDPGAPLATAADAVRNWFALLHPELKIESESRTRIRSAEAVRLEAVGRGLGAARASLDVIAHEGGFLVLLCSAPGKAWDELAADFAFVQRTLELDAEAIAPKLQGPLAAAAAKNGKAPQTRPVGPRSVDGSAGGTASATAWPSTAGPATAAPPAPLAAPAVPRELPHVRVPTGY